MTTAIVALTALPVTAQMSDNVQTGDAAQSAQGQTAVQAQVQAQMDLREDVEAADLNGKRIFMSRQAATQQGQESDQSGLQPGIEQDLDWVKTGRLVDGSHTTEGMWRHRVARLYPIQPRPA